MIFYKTYIEQVVLFWKSEFCLVTTSPSIAWLSKLNNIVDYEISKVCRFIGTNIFWKNWAWKIEHWLQRANFQTTAKDIRTSSDHHLFWFLQKFFNGGMLNALEACKNWFKGLVAEKDEKFFGETIIKLPNTWQKFIEINVVPIYHPIKMIIA